MRDSGHERAGHAPAGSPPEPSPVDVMQSAERYREFYESLGTSYPETDVVHGDDRRRFAAILREISRFARQGARLLDIGCNDGVYVVPYCRAGGTAHGIDISAALVERAKQKARGLRATFEVADIETYAPADRYDLVLMSEVLEHVRRPELAVRNAVACVRPGGSFLLSTPIPHNVPSWRYVTRLLARDVLLEPFTVRTDLNVIGQRFGMRGIQYRHDGYYPLALKDWVEGFGTKCTKAYTIGRRLSLQMPLMSLIGGETNVQLFRKPA